MSRKSGVDNRILVVDDDPIMRDFLREFFLERGFLPDLAVDGIDALHKFTSKDYIIILADLKMPGMDDLTLLQQINEINSNIPFIIFTAYGSIDTAIKATKMGAFNYIVKPISPDELEIVVMKATEYSKLLKENEELRKKLWDKDSRIIGTSRIMQNVAKVVEAVANSRATVLIEGESGTGKELIAKALHKSSSRVDGPFIKVNCASIPETLLESELFGCVEGAYTGASKNRMGKFEAADNGTLLLDEICETSLQFQAKLLRVLQEMEVERIGSNKPIKVDVRVVATTNKNLKNEVKKGKFREDLYYRLNVIPINVPPIRKRKNDVPLLVNYFIIKYSIENGKKPIIIEPDLMNMLKEYHWPGNVREIENFIYRTVVTSNNSSMSRKVVEQLINTSPQNEQSIPIDEFTTLQDVEKMMIVRALEKTQGNKTEAANILGITTRTIYNKLKQFSNDDFDFSRIES